MDSNFKKQLKSREFRADSEELSCLGWSDPMTEGIYICHFERRLN